MCNYGAISLPVSFHAVNNVWCDLCISSKLEILAGSLISLYAALICAAHLTGSIEPIPVPKPEHIRDFIDLLG